LGEGGLVEALATARQAIRNKARQKQLQQFLIPARLFRTPG
jgi:hypothetical protein